MKSSREGERSELQAARVCVPTSFLGGAVSAGAAIPRHPVTEEASEKKTYQLHERCKRKVRSSLS
jgi:hypothetical protein